MAEIEGQAKKISQNFLAYSAIGAHLGNMPRKVCVARYDFPPSGGPQPARAHSRSTITRANFTAGNKRISSALQTWEVGMRCNRLYGRWHQGRKRGKNPFSLPLVRRYVVKGTVRVKPVRLAPGHLKANEGPVMVPPFTRNGGWEAIPVKVLLHVHNPNKPGVKTPGNVVSKPHGWEVTPVRQLCAVPPRDYRKSRNDRRDYDWQRVPHGFDHVVTGRFTMRP